MVYSCVSLNYKILWFIILACNCKSTKILLLATSHIAIAHLWNQFNHVFALLTSMPHFKRINIIRIGLKLSYFCKKKKFFFERWGLRPRPPKHPSLQISGCAPESNYVFALLISMQAKFSLMPRLKSLNFYQNKPKIIFAKNLFRVLGLCPQTL